MILAGLILLAVGAADLVRQFVPKRWIGYLVVVVALLLLGSGADAPVAMIMAPIAGAVWVWTMPTSRESRLTFWPAVALAVISVFAVVWFGERGDAGLIGAAWRLDSPFGPISFDIAILAVGITAFLLESGNLVVRAALSGEHTWRPDEENSVEATSPATEATTEPATEPARPRGGFKGGRLIGPLERLIVFLLTLGAAYPILAAMLAAKGIIRFPEISKDGETGGRAEYFLVGSLVSWLIGLGGAFLLWWAVLA